MLTSTLRKNYLYSARLAAEWLVETAQKKDRTLEVNEDNKHDLRHEDWRGAIRGEYSVAEGRWSFFCPVWHTGQAVKALALLYRVTSDEWMLEGAKLGASFLEANANRDPSDTDFGFLKAFEDFGGVANTSAILEATDGLLVLAGVTGERKYRDLAARAVDWVFRTQYLRGEGLFWDLYDPFARRTVETVRTGETPRRRPLNDDAQLLRVAKATGNREMEAAFYEVCERLLEDEGPPGNWIRYGPCDEARGSIHPRHAYWWGRPFVDAYRDSGDERYLGAAVRSGEWYLRAVRHDGGLFRNTYVDFNTDSFGHATSGVACAALLWNDLAELTGEKRWGEAVLKALGFCQRMQFTMPRDENLYGAILEKVLPFDGTDANPYHIRDLGSIFYVQAVAEVAARERP
ncbi:MAG: hypothetical protein ACTSU5_01405 [Promethearchaeota archaeon]